MHKSLLTNHWDKLNDTVRSCLVELSDEAIALLLEDQHILMQNFDDDGIFSLYHEMVSP